jgi:8-oxo-dGTP pyrophosphatase MutT (NUDIX family)
MADTTRPEAPLKPAATVMIIRDGADGLEVFMVVRHHQIDFASGALVFPGGKVEASDAAPVWVRMAEGTRAHPAREFWVASVRETFEESGLLLAKDASSGAYVSPDLVAGRLAQQRARLLSDAVTFETLMTDAGLVIAAGDMVHFAHWMTPVTMPKRFDTHFFLVAAPEGQIATHDGGEAVESHWVRPAEAIADAAAGRRTLVPATTLNLEKLARWPTVDAALEGARREAVVPILPKVSKAEGGVTIRIPADAGYVTTEVFIPRASPA